MCTHGRPNEGDGERFLEHVCSVAKELGVVTVAFKVVGSNSR
jgi:hypothetical protein